MNSHDAFELLLELKQTNRILKNLLTVEVLKERRLSETIDREQHKNLLEMLVRNTLSPEE